MFHRRAVAQCTCHMEKYNAVAWSLGQNFTDKQQTEKPEILDEYSRLDKQITLW